MVENPALTQPPEHWAEMKAVITEILPKLGEDGRWHEVMYKATDNKDILNTQPRGRVLFKFDPEHIKNGNSRRSKHTQLAMLWVETREVHRDEWIDA
jgi:hypothetical protein